MPSPHDGSNPVSDEPLLPYQPLLPLLPYQPLLVPCQPLSPQPVSATPLVDHGPDVDGLGGTEVVGLGGAAVGLPGSL